MDHARELFEAVEHDAHGGGGDDDVGDVGYGFPGTFGWLCRI